MSMLFIKGIKEPFAITKEEAVAVKGVLENIKISPEQVVSVAGWTGQKKDLRFVTVEKEKVYSQERSFSNEEMRNFKKEKLEKYLVNGYLTLASELKFYADIGVARVRALKEEPKTFSDFDFAIIDVPGYKSASEMIGGFRDYCDRVAFAKKKEAEELQASSLQYAG